MVWMFPGYQGLFSMWWYIIYGYILCVANVSSDSYRFSSGHAVELDMSADKFLNDGNCFSGQECTEDSAGSNSVESVKDTEGQKNRCCQAGKVESGFDHFVFFL